MRTNFSAHSRRMRRIMSGEIFMGQRQKLWWVLLAAAAVGGIIWSCDRLSGDVAGNQAPTVAFVNVPLDSSQFSYAPTVYWTGYDPDGLITAYQYRDDASPEAVAAYRESDAALEAYISHIPATGWVSTDSTEETIYLLTDEGDTTEHVFMIRSVDDRGATSPVKVRIFFRTNQAPNTPEVKKVPLPLENDQEFATDFEVHDTLFIGDKPTVTWGGLQFLWQGTDPDSRELNIIPLQFSYLLRNLDTDQIIPFARILDSSRVEYVADWSDWSSETQVVYSALHPYMESGHYEFQVRVRDDGLTLSDTNAVLHFYAIRPSFEKQLLIVDENRPLSGNEPIQGGRNDQVIDSFYYANIPQAFQIAEFLRPFALPDLQVPFDYDTSSSGPVAWFRNKNLDLETTIPYSTIQHYQWIWLIDDDNTSVTPTDTSIKARERVMSEYMDVGGQVMMSGRRILNDSYNVSGDIPTNGNVYGQFFNDYFNLQTVSAKTRFSPATSGVPDFGGATTSNPYMPPLEVDTTVTIALTWLNRHYSCLPEIDYFGRNNTVSGYDYSQTLYNYNSCSANQSYDTTNVDCDVATSTPTQAFLKPAAGHTRLLNVTRAYNRTRGVYGEFMYIRRQYDSQGNPLDWQIVVSTPAANGAWTSADTLEVDYSYIPISVNHGQPVATQYIRMEGVVNVDFQTGRFSFTGETRFRTVFFTFPFSFLKTDPVDLPLVGSVNPVAAAIAYQILYFNSPRTIEFNQGD
jgi:hypothetical protein